LAWAVDIVKEVIERMRPLFYPKSVAIVGASDNPTRFGYARLKCLLDFGYKGAVYLVNPRLAGKEVLGLKCYGSVLDIPDEVDLAYMDVSARTALSVLRDCGKKEVKAAIIFAGGFSDVGDEGRKLEDEIQAIAKETGMVILGPNRVGVTNLYANLCTFALNLGNLNLDARSLEPLSLVRGFHPGKIVSSGNEVVVTLTEVLEYFVEDPRHQGDSDVHRSRQEREEVHRALQVHDQAPRGAQGREVRGREICCEVAHSRHSRGLERGLQAGGHNPSRELRGALRALHGLGEPAEAPRQ
jgi:predicted CoA-binding protein